MTELPWEHWIWLAFTSLAYYGMIRDAVIVWRLKGKAVSPREIEKLVEARKAFRNWWRVCVILTFVVAVILFNFYKGTI
jgi:hypothetical protein